MVKLGPNRFGKAEVRLVRVSRGAAGDGGDLIRDWNISSSLSGDLDAVHLSGDNANVLATDTQKNTAYAFAQQYPDCEPEAFALLLANHFVSSQPAMTRARVAIDDYSWTRLAGQHAFVRSGQYVRTTVVLHDSDAGVSVVSGLKDLVVLKTTGSAFAGFVRDRYTTLPETDDRMLATAVTASWRFRPGAVEEDWAAVHQTARDALLDSFATTDTDSLQQTMYLIGEQILTELPQLCEVRMAMPNKHHFLVDLSPFGQGNDNEVYYAADRPYGLIEAAVLADDAPAEGLAWT